MLLEWKKCSALAVFPDLYYSVLTFTLSAEGAHAPRAPFGYAYAHNTHHYNESDVCSIILFYNDECIANMPRVIQIGRL
jgi:hypothetical protein